MVMLQMFRKFKFECNCHSGPNLTKYNVGHQRWHNVAWMLCEHWFPTLGTDVETTFTQCCLSVVWTLADFPPTLWQCCGNFGIWVEIQHWYNVHTILYGHPHNIAGIFKSIYIWMLSQRWDWHSDNVGTNIVTTLPQCWSISWAEVCFHAVISLQDVAVHLNAWNYYLYDTFYQGLKGMYSTWYCRTCNG